MNKLLNSMVFVLVSVVLISCNNQQKSGNTVSYGNPIVEKSYKNEKQEFIESVVSDLKKMLPISDANSTNLVEINMTTNTITYKYEVVLNGKYDDQPTAEEWEKLSDALEDLEVYEEDVIEY